MQNGLHNPLRAMIEILDTENGRNKIFQNLNLTCYVFKTFTSEYMF